MSNKSKATPLTKDLGKPDFQVRFHHCQNTCWQGELHWLNTGERINFRSLLELISLMQEAVEISGKPDAECDVRSWDVKNNNLKALSN